MKRVALFVAAALLLAAGFGLAYSFFSDTDPALALTLEQVEPQDIDSIDANAAQAFSYQGYLEQDGSPVSGAVNLNVRFYSNSTCTTQVGPQIPRTVTVDNGRFHMVVPVGEGVFTGQKIFARIMIGSTAIGCREVLPTPYALSLSPGAEVDGSVEFNVGPYGGAMLAVLNDAGRVVYGEKLGSTSGSAGYFISHGETSGVHAESEQGDGIRSSGGGGGNDYGGEFRGWGGILTVASTGPGVLVSDAAGVATTAGRHPGDIIASDDLIADDALSVGAPGSHAEIYAKDDANVVMLEFTASNGLLTLGGVDDDGDIYVQNASDQRTLSMDGATSTVWGNVANVHGDLNLHSHDDIVLGLDQDGSSAGVLRVRRDNGTDVCTINEGGNLTCTGAKNAVVTTASAGQRLLYAMESPGVWFEDFGSGQLTEGAAVVNLEPIFAETVNAGVPYHVYVTPVGGWAGLYVTDKTPTSFTVRAQGGDANVAFNYRIVAKRLGYEDVRLAQYPAEEEAAEVQEPQLEAAAGPEEVTLRNADEVLGVYDPSLDIAPAEEARD